MKTYRDSLYCTYGAFELKATYQRNLALANVTVILTISLILLGFWLNNRGHGDEVVLVAPRVIKTVAELGPPPTVVKKPPQIKVNSPTVNRPRVGIPKPVADEEILDDDVVLATRDEMAEISAPAIIEADGGEGLVVDIADDDFDLMPEMDQFVPVEIMPEMIHHVQPEYPRMAEQVGLEGRVWIKALVYKDGSVKDAVVYKSSGTPALDEAALAVASLNKFKPAIQNGKPVSIWVTYQVDFVLKRLHL